MRLVTWNIAHGADALGGSASAAQMERAISQIAPDVLAIQEVDWGLSRSRFVDFATAARTAMDAHSVVSAKVLIDDGGALVAASPQDLTSDMPGYGIALLSQFPVIESKIHSLPSIPRQVQAALRLRDEARVAIEASLDCNGTRLRLVATHLTRSPGWSVLQLAWLRRTRRGSLDAILGDLNMPYVPPMVFGRMQPAARLETHPSAVPVRQLDHVLLAEGRWRTRQVESRQMRFSDHRALIVDAEYIVDKRADTGQSDSQSQRLS